MQMVDLIRKKRDGGTLSAAEISEFISGYVRGEIPDYQASAFLMAVWYRGMDERETADLTRAMVQSGDTIDLSRIPGLKVDKHSTGGVADTTTLVVLPIVAACGGKAAKMSGRGLGHTGGTLDKLESIPGFSVDQSMDTFIRIVSDHGLAVIGQTGELVPADKKLYALRDVTATVDSIPLIAGSIMSKKLAAGSDAIVLDVKTGSGAFMKELDQAEALARSMVRIGKTEGRRMSALVTDMSQPLGMAVGNALEVQEAVEILSNKRTGGDLRELSLRLAERMLLISEICRDESTARAAVHRAVESGDALERFGRMIAAQGGDRRVLEDTGRLPRAGEVLPVVSTQAGFVTSMKTEEIGMACLLLGAGRTKKNEPIDPAVGIWMNVRIGDAVKKGDVLGYFHVNRKDRLEEARMRFLSAVQIGGEKPVPVRLIHSIV